MRPRQVLLLACLTCLAAAGPASARELGQRPLAPGSQGHDVRVLQRSLTVLGFPARPADGMYGPRTARAVRSWQRARHLRRDGRLTRSEVRRLQRERRDLKRGSGGATVGRSDSPPADEVGGEQPGTGVEGAVGPGTSGEAVRQAQVDLARLGFPVGSPDGAYGEGTAAAIRSYQSVFFGSQTGALSAAAVARLHRRVDTIPDGPHAFPLQGSWTFSGKDGRYGADRGAHVHAGQDLPAPGGTPLVAVTSGSVTTRAFQKGGAGNYVVLQGDDGVDYVYMHLRKPALAKAGQRVSAGQALGEVGQTGHADGTHLHFEAWTAHWYAGGHHFDPLPALLAWR